MTLEPDAGGEGQPCADMRGRLSDFHDGRYEPASPDAVSVEEHLATCPRCAEILADYRLISDVAKCLRDQECAPPRGAGEFAARVREAIARRLRRKVMFWSGWGVAAAAAAAVILAFVLAPEIERPGGASLARVPARGVGDQAHEKTAVLAPDLLREAPDEIPAAADLEAVRREIEEAEKLGGGRMPGVVPVGEGAVSLDRHAPPPGALLGVYVSSIEGGPPSEGAVVVGVVPGSPAALGGIRPRDVILEVGGQAIGTGGARRLQEIARRAGPGASVKLIFRRGKMIREVEIVLAELDVGR